MPGQVGDTAEEVQHISRIEPRIFLGSHDVRSRTVLELNPTPPCGQPDGRGAWEGPLAYVWEEGGGPEGELLPGKGLVNGRHLGRRRLEWFTRKERAVFCRDLH